MFPVSGIDARRFRTMRRRRAWFRKSDAWRDARFSDWKWRKLSARRESVAMR